jgi:hypothetical protein
MDYTTLIADKNTYGSIKSWISYDRIAIDAILEEAQTYLYSRMRVREMRATADVVLSSGAITAALPTRYIDPISMKMRNFNYGIKHKTQESLEARRNWDTALNNWSQGLPSVFSVYNEVINFDIRADQNYNLRFSFFQQPALLGVSNQTNFLTERYPMLLRLACMRGAAEFMEAMDKFERYDRRLKEAIAELDVMDELSLTGIDLDLEHNDA